MSSLMVSCPHCHHDLPDGNGQRPKACPHCGRGLEPANAPTEPEWFYARDRRKTGPVTWRQLQQLAANGQLRAADMVLCAGASHWQPAESVPGLFAVAQVVADLIPFAQPITVSGPEAGPQPADSELKQTVARVSAEAPQRTLVIPTVPGYEIRGLLGRGGMGVVYQAEQVRLKRTVALKMVLAGAHASAIELERFRVEAEAVARLQHPNIVQIHEIGEHEGLPFFSLEFCGGGALSGRLDGTPQPPGEAAELVEVLAGALQAAHEKGIIHRDLKPSNVLLTDAGTPKVTDFGLAKQLDAGDGPTSTGAVVGTPSYMAPEQALGRLKEIGPATDVYSLGAILYELLTGRPPFKGATAMDTVMQVVTDEPVPPRRLQPKVPVDLEVICLRCLQKERHRRYASAAALADDLRRYREGRPIMARPASTVERAWKWARRRPALAALGTVSVAAAVALLVVGAYFTQELSQEKNHALTERNEAIRLEGLARDAAERAEDARKRTAEEKAEAERQKKAADRAREEKARQLDHARRTLFNSQIWRAAGLWDRDPDQGRQLLADADLCPHAMRDFAWGYYYRLCHGEGRLLHRGPTPIDHVAITADGKWLAATTGSTHVQLWNLRSGQAPTTLKAGKRIGADYHGWRGAGHCLAFSPDGRTLATANADRTITLWDVDATRERATLKGQTSEVYDIAFSPDGQWLVSGGGVFDPKVQNHDFQRKKGEIRLWDAAAGQPGRVLLAGNTSAISCVAFSPDSKTVAAGTTHQVSVKLLNVDTGKETTSFRAGGWIYGVAFSPDGESLAVSSANQTVQIVDVKLRKVRCAFPGHYARDLHFSADSKTIASRDEAIRLSDTATGQEIMTLRAPVGEFSAMAFTPDGQTLVSGGDDGSIRLWQKSRRPERASFAGAGFFAVAVSPNGKTLAAATGDKQVKLWDLVEGREQKSLSFDGLQPRCLAFTRDGRTLLVGLDARTDKASRKTTAEVQLWDLAGYKRRGSLKGHSGAIIALGLAQEDRLLVTGSRDGTVRLWDLPAQKEIGQLPTRYKAGVQSLAVSPDGRTIATVGRDAQKANKQWDLKRREITLWDVAGRRPRTTETLPGRDVTCLAFAPDGQKLAVGLDDYDAQKHRGSVMLLGVSANPPTRTSLPVATGAVDALAFSPDGKVLAVPASRNSVQLWDPVTGQLRAQLEGHANPVRALAFSHDGRTLASASQNFQERASVSWVGEVKVWAAADPGPRRSIVVPNGSIDSLIVSRDGRTLITVAGQYVRWWDPATCRLRNSIHFDPQELLTAALAPDNGVLAVGYRPGTEIVLWDPTTGRELGALPGHAGCPHRLVFSAHGRKLASGSCDSTVKLWDLASGTEKITVPSNGEAKFDVPPFAVSPDGTSLVVGRVNGSIEVWDAATGQQRTLLRGHTERINGLTFNPAHQILASAANDGTVRLWDFAAGKERFVLRVNPDGSVKRGPGGVLFSPDGKTVATVGPAWTVRLWDVFSGQERATMQGHAGDVSAVAFSPDGKLLATVSDQRAITLWDVGTGRERATLGEHVGSVWALQFLPDGKTLASADRDRTVLLWDVPEALERGPAAK